MTFPIDPCTRYLISIVARTNSIWKPLQYYDSSPSPEQAFLMDENGQNEASSCKRKYLSKIFQSPILFTTLCENPNRLVRRSPPKWSLIAPTSPPIPIHCHPPLLKNHPKRVTRGMQQFTSNAQDKSSNGVGPNSKGSNGSKSSNSGAIFTLILISSAVLIVLCALLVVLALRQRVKRRNYKWHQLPLDELENSGENLAKNAHLYDESDYPSIQAGQFVDHCRHLAQNQETGIGDCFFAIKFINFQAI